MITTKNIAGIVMLVGPLIGWVFYRMLTHDWVFPLMMIGLFAWILLACWLLVDQKPARDYTIKKLEW